MARPRSFGQFLLWAAIGLAGLFVLIQAVPYGRKHRDPPVTREVRWNSPQTRALAARACFDCHSNLTAWPWYSNVAPVSWLLQRDVDDGRATLNFSEWNRPQEGAGDAAEAARGGMSPWFYTFLGAALAAGLAATIAADPPPGGAGG
jgi:hypothetical protein